MKSVLPLNSTLMNQNSALIALDVGEKRIGVAAADGIVSIARPLGTIEVDGSEIDQVLRYASAEKAALIVVGYPRNQSGDATAQSVSVEAFVERLQERTNTPLVFQDESLTSVLAEERLKSYKKPYTKGDIDAQAATFILQDYLESKDGRI